ncbi:MAG TPA: phospholipase D-like domain-containing protein [Candidatus Saccharibacteria bacterium]|nr:phospholipase D-like domain-containing protein [Candidatus Saccharibacteria bacterium]
MLTRAQLLLPKDYLQDAVRCISLARTQISLLTMIVVEDDTTQPLIDALCEAAKRGVRVTVAVDMFTYAEVGGHFKFNTRHSKAIKHITTMQRRLQRAGVTFRWLGTAATSLVSGRTHSKWLVVDDTVYTFGGVNLYQSGIQNIDYMFRTKDVGLATHLFSEQRRVMESDRRGRTYRSHMFGDDINSVLIDGGFAGESIIYRHACRLAKQARQVTYVSQYCPTGRLGRLLKTTDTELYFNPWNKANSLNALTIRVGSWLSGHKTAYARDTYLHAKCIVFTMHDGSKVALTGSHNFSHGGVWLGTREIALETRDPRIIRQLERFIRSEVA